jgi:hypothetical protein
VGSVLFVGAAIGKINRRGMRTIWPFYLAAVSRAAAGDLHPGAVAVAAGGAAMRRGIGLRALSAKDAKDAKKARAN